MVQNPKLRDQYWIICHVSPRNGTFSHEIYFLNKTSMALSAARIFFLEKIRYVVLSLLKNPANTRLFDYGRFVKPAAHCQHFHDTGQYIHSETLLSP